MKTIALYTLLILSAIQTEVYAQWNVGAEAGINKQELSGWPNGRPQVYSQKSYVSFISELYAIYETEAPVNLGFGLSVKNNKVHNYLYAGNTVSGINTLSIDHRSVFLSVHPVVDVPIGKHRYFHLLVHPNINILMGGTENGYRQYSTGEKVANVNTSENIKRVALGASAQLQFRYPVNKYLKATIAPGYSINNSVSRYVPGEKGNFFLQAGVNYILPRIKKEDKSSGNQIEQTK